MAATRLQLKIFLGIAAGVSILGLVVYVLTSSTIFLLFSIPNLLFASFFAYKLVKLRKPM
ncbi:MAG TPA: hypothetical protein VH415_06835 [Nitrososphaeraceae archaeon]